jgi:flagellar biogenesis protein FliO
MPNIRIIMISPWRRLIPSALVLGVCLFHFSFISNAFAIDSSSPLFQQSQVDSKTNEKKNQPLALPEETPNPSPGLLSTFIRLVFAVVITGGLIFLTVWGLKFIWEKRGFNNLSDENKPVKILNSTYLAPRKTIHLVEIGSRILVVGVGNDELSCLDVITEAGEVEALRRASQQNFPNIFNRLIQKENIAKQEEETNRIIEESNKTLGGYVDKLKKVSRKKKEDIHNSGENE